MKCEKYFAVMYITCLVIITAAIVVLYELHTNYTVKVDSGRTDPRGAGSSSTINPGCRERTLKAYRPVKTERCYHHPSIVHYAKFHKEQGGSLSLIFIENISMLSAYKVLQPKLIFPHSNG